jgi:hypothetical protein
MDSSSVGDICNGNYYKDVRILVRKIDAEILSQTKNKERRQKARAQQTRRTDISRHYDHLVKGEDHPVVPVLAEFRRLPIIKALQDREDSQPQSDTARSFSTKLAKSPHILESELKNSELIRNMVDSDIKRWIDTAREAFNSMLGQPEWRSASTIFLHPAERVTARFICTRCSSQPKKGAILESLNFREACAHQCVRQRKRGAAKRKWRADQFTPDQKVYVRCESHRSPEAKLLHLQAIKVLSQAISLLGFGFKVERRETKDKIEALSPRFLCNSCDPPIMMNFQRLVLIVLG